MKFLFYSVLFLFPVANSFAQAPISDTSGITIRSTRGDCYYYIDGIKVRGSANLPTKAIEEVSIITGGLPVNYGDVGSGCTIRFSETLLLPRRVFTSDKEQKMATE